MSDFKYEIIERIGVISTTNSGWTREMNIVSFNEREGKYDLRDWAPDRASMSKGLTFTKDELMILKEILKPIK